MHNESAKCVIKQVHERVVTGDGMDGNINATNSYTTVADPAAIQLIVAKLRLDEQKLSTISICEIIVV